jgi:hypothetical protein
MARHLSRSIMTQKNPQKQANPGHGRGMRYRAVNVHTTQTPPPAHPFQIYNLKEQSSA